MSSPLIARVFSFSQKQVIVQLGHKEDFHMIHYRFIDDLKLKELTGANS